jgi:uncharacterized GH25 family protein
MSLFGIPAFSHELWVETEVAAAAGTEHAARVCWGHSGDKATGESLKQQQARLSARCVRPDGRTQALDLVLGRDSFAAKVSPERPGYYVIGSQSQVGIIDKEFHGIPAGTRIVMYGKSLVHVAGSDQGLGNQTGFDLEILPVTDPAHLHPGDVVVAKVFFKGKPLGGRDVVVSLKTVGPKPPAEDPRIQSAEWTIEANADPRTGEVAFPLIVGGRHLFFIRYFDNHPGRYQGDRDLSSELSHLRKGDTYERTMYVATFAVDVKAD